VEPVVRTVRMGIRTIVLSRRLFVIDVLFGLFLDLLANYLGVFSDAAHGVAAADRKEH